MRKRYKLFIFLLIFAMIVLTACSSNNEQENTEWSMFSAIADLSEVNWYLTQTYSQDAPKQCNYYEFFDVEVHYILVEISKEASGLDHISYNLFLYDNDLDDWYEYHYDSNHEVTSIEIVDIANDVSVYKLTFDIDGEYDIYIAYLEDGKISKIAVDNNVGMNRGFCYTFASSGMIESINWIDMNDIYAFMSNEDIAGEEIDFVYNQEGTLKEVSGWYYGDYYQFDYKDSKRIKTTHYSGEDKVTVLESVLYNRSENALTESVDVFGEYEEKTSYELIYHNDGTVEFLHL